MPRRPRIISEQTKAAAWVEIGDGSRLIRCLGEVSPRGVNKLSTGRRERAGCLCVMTAMDEYGLRGVLESEPFLCGVKGGA
jgi:hypothetical protein